MHSGASGVDAHHPHTLQRLLHLVDGTESRKHPRHQLQVAQGLIVLRRIILGIFSILGKIEQSGRQACLVHPLHHIRVFLHGQPHIPISGRKAATVLGPSRQPRLLGIARGHYHITAVQVTSGPLNGAGGYGETILGGERDARAGNGIQRTHHPGGNGHPYIQSFHTHSS